MGDGGREGIRPDQGDEIQEDEQYKPLGDFCARQWQEDNTIRGGWVCQLASWYKKGRDGTLENQVDIEGMS